jgi:hypothetical protein
MKKQFLLVGVIVAMGLGSFFMACDDDDDTQNVHGCKCTNGGNSDDEIWTTEEMKAEVGVDNCEDLEKTVYYGHRIPVVCEAF